MAATTAANPVAVLGLAALLSVSCGGTASPAQKPRTTASASLANEYHWQATTAEAGVLRVEKEQWHLKPEGDGVVGNVVREVRFISTDGQDFACAQGPSYRQWATYQIAGAPVDRARWELKEVDVRVESGPCEKGTRPLHSYRARPQSDGSLQLTWTGGQQQLALGSAERDSAPASTIEGTWHWQTQEQLADGAQRTEKETWTFSPTTEHARGATPKLRGSYHRQVQLAYRDGRNFACAQNSTYSYTDTYDFVASEGKRGWLLQETHYESAPHPCLASTERVLDSARMTHEGDVVVLGWRGKKTQVLHRQLSQP